FPADIRPDTGCCNGCKLWYQKSMDPKASARIPEEIRQYPGENGTDTAWSRQNSALHFQTDTVVSALLSWLRKRDAVLLPYRLWWNVSWKERFLHSWRTEKHKEIPVLWRHEPSSVSLCLWNPGRHCWKTRRRGPDNVPECFLLRRKFHIHKLTASILPDCPD